MAEPIEAGQNAHPSLGASSPSLRCGSQRREGCTRAISASVGPMPTRPRSRARNNGSGQLPQEELVATPRTACLPDGGVELPCPPSPSTYAARRPRTAGVGTELGASVSGSAAVLVDEAAEHIDPLDRPRAEGKLIGHRGDFEAKPAVGPGTIVMVDVCE